MDQRVWISLDLDGSSERAENKEQDALIDAVEVRGYVEHHTFDVLFC